MTGATIGLTTIGLTTIGLIGIGLMGKPIARRLLAAGHTLVVHDVDPGRMAEPVALGAIGAATPAEIARRADLVMTCVTNGTALEQVVFGPDGLATVSDGAGLLADLSSVHPDTTRTMAHRLLVAAGMRWVDAPVSGGVRGAETGSLVIFCGGDEADVARVRDVSTAFAARVTHFGGIGSGQAAKLCNQSLVGATLAALAETLNFARRAGLDPAMLPEAFKGGFADSPPLQTWGPRMASGNFEPKLGSISGILEDLDAATEFARGCGAPLPVLSAAAEAVRLYAAGPGKDADTSSLIRLYETWSGEGGCNGSN